MEEQLISFETAKLGKEKGFDIECNRYYQNVDPEEEENFEYEKIYSPQAMDWNSILDGRCSRPTQSLLKKWLREEKKIDIEITTYKRLYYQYALRMVPPIDRNRKMYGTYENALEDSLKEALT